MLSRTLDRWVPGAIIVGVVGALFLQTRHYGLMGFDSYPVILTSRVGSLADLIGTFTEKLMDGRYSSEFHRPLLNLSFALDHAVWGLDAFGYQLTNAMILAAAAWALWLLLRRLLGSEAWFGTLLGLGVFVFSSLHFEVLPVPPRRPELLCCLFTALALALQLSPRALGGDKPPPWPALATLAAIASKESGYVTPVLVAFAVFMYVDRATLRERALYTVRALVPHLALVALMIVVRLLVLGGIGGHQTVSIGDLLSSAGIAMHIVAYGLMLPQPAMSGAVAGQLLLLGLVLTLSATLIWAAVRERGEAQSMPKAHKAALVALAWIALLGVTYAAAGLIGPWYLLLPLAGWALLTGALAERLLALTDSASRRLGWLAVAALALLVALLVWQSSYSPVFRHYDEWERATRASDAFLTETHSILAVAPDGSVAEAPPMPAWVAPRGGGPAVRGGAVFADYSIQAWAELVFPERRIRVTYAGPDVPPPSSDEVLLLITRRLDDL